MKTQQEIEKWLKSQKWFEKYKWNLKLSPVDADKFLNGEEGIHTISGAFPWEITEEGFAYWAEVDYKFTHWICGE